MVQVFLDNYYLFNIRGEREWFRTFFTNWFILLLLLLLLFRSILSQRFNSTLLCESFFQFVQGVVGKGKYYYEATVTDEGLCRLGFSTSQASLGGYYIMKCLRQKSILLHCYWNLTTSDPIGPIGTMTISSLILFLDNYGFMVFI